MQKNFSKTPLFLSILFFLFSCLISVFFYRTIDSKSKDSQLKEEEWQNETYRRDEIKMLDNSVKIMEKERAQLETHFAQSSNVVPFLDTIEGLALKVGIEAKVTSVDILTNHSGLVVGVKASGTFNGLYKFLTLLENSLYELKLIGVNMRQGTGATVLKWDAVFQIKLLSFVE